MNKIYLFTAAFAVMASLSGCSDTELASIDTAQEKTPIGFHTVGSQMGSRATSINSGNITGYSFNVYAFTRKEVMVLMTLYSWALRTRSLGLVESIYLIRKENGIIPPLQTSSIGLLAL